MNPIEPFNAMDILVLYCIKKGGMKEEGNALWRQSIRVAHTFHMLRHMEGNYGGHVGHMEGNFVCCSQNAMFALPRIFSICCAPGVCQLEMQYILYIMPEYVDTIKILGARVSIFLQGTFVLHMLLNLLAKILKASCSCIAIE